MDSNHAPSPERQHSDSRAPQDEHCAERGALRHERLAALERLDAFQVMRDIGHGRIENLLVRAGAPHISTKTKLLRCFRPDRAGGRADSPAIPGRNQHLRQLKFLAHCRSVGNGVIEKVEIADGLPVFWRSEQSKELAPAQL